MRFYAYFLSALILCCIITQTCYGENTENLYKKNTILQGNIDNAKRELEDAKRNWEWGRTSHFESSRKEAEMYKQKIPLLEEKIRILQHEQDLTKISVQSKSESDYRNQKKILLDEKIAKVKREISDAKSNWEWNRTSNFESSRLEGEASLAKIPGLEQELQRLEIEKELNF